MSVLNITLRPRQDGCHFPDDIFRFIFLNENIRIAINISLSFVPKGRIDNIPASVQIMAWRRSGDKPLSEPMMVSLLTHICGTRPQWDIDNQMLASSKHMCTFYGILLRWSFKTVWVVLWFMWCELRVSIIDGPGYNLWQNWLLKSGNVLVRL